MKRKKMNSEEFDRRFDQGEDMGEEMKQWQSISKEAFDVEFLSSTLQENKNSPQTTPKKSSKTL